jgi:hypothetical protein
MMLACREEGARRGAGRDPARTHRRRARQPAGAAVIAAWAEHAEFIGALIVCAPSRSKPARNFQGLYRMSKSQNPLHGRRSVICFRPMVWARPELEKTFRKLMRHDIDFADLYFQYQRSEAWSLEEGIVKSGSFDIEQGVGVRAISGEKTAFAYSDDISLDALLERGDGDAGDRRCR